MSNGLQDTMHSLGKGEVGSSNLLGSTIPNLVNYWMKITFQEVFKIQRISMKID